MWPDDIVWLHRHADDRGLDGKMPHLFQGMQGALITLRSEWCKKPAASVSQLSDVCHDIVSDNKSVMHIAT
jgi:hypothetical protein